MVEPSIKPLRKLVFFVPALALAVGWAAYAQSTPLLVRPQSAPTLKRSFDGNYGRLQQIKATYDPTDFFRSNLNIRPG